MSAEVHFGDARRRAIEALTRILDTESAVEKAVLGHDLFGLLRVILWLLPDADEQALRAHVAEALTPCGRFWTGEIWVSAAGTSRPDRLVYQAAWEEGISVPDVDRLRIDDRTRTRTAWLPRFREPAWRLQATAPGKALAEDEGPPIVVFYSFKGGVGRTTALAAFALARAQAGERVLVVDLDLDAPGAGALLTADTEASPRGVVDYLLEAPLGPVEIDDYVHHCRRASLVGDAGGEIVVMPAGCVDEDYLLKLSRLDLEVRRGDHPLEDLLGAARDALRPDWILLDSRAGLASAAGLLLDGIAHTHVLFGTNSAQSQLGLRQVLRTLGAERVHRGLGQARCLLVQAMIVDLVEVERLSRAEFDGWLDKAVRELYAVSDEDDPDDALWSVRDLDSDASPSRAVAVPYKARLAFFPKLEDVASDLVAGPYLDMGARILRQLRPEEPSAED